MHRWHWLDDILIPLLVIVLRLCWVWPWLEMLRRWLMPSQPAPLLPLGLLFGLFVGSYGLTRVAVVRTHSQRRARLWVGTGGVAVVVMVLWWAVARQYPLWNPAWVRYLALTLSNWAVELPAAYLVLFVTTGIWVRGVLDARQHRTRDDIWSAFAWGAVAFAVLLLLAQLDPRGLPAGTANVLVLYFVVGLAALALSSLELSRITGRWDTPSQPRLKMNRYWLLSVGGVIAAMVLVGLALGMILTPAAVAQAFGWIGTVLSWIGAVVAYLFMGFAYVLFLFLTPLYEWARRRMDETPPPEQEPMQFGDFEELLTTRGEQPLSQLSPAVVESLRWLWFVALLVAVGLGIALALRIFRAREDDEIEETREIIFSRGLLQEQLGTLWSNWMARFQHGSAAQVDPYLALAGESATRRSIRAQYQALLARAAALGMARTPPQTPQEYGAKLAQSSAEDDPAWREMTDGYMQARYGEQPPSDAQAARVQRAWARVQELWASQAPSSAGSSSSAEDDDDIAADDAAVDDTAADAAAAAGKG